MSRIGLQAELPMKEYDGVSLVEELLLKREGKRAQYRCDGLINAHVCIYIYTGYRAACSGGKVV